MFKTKYQEILELIDYIDPIKYGKTRNFYNGAVTKLSPYISRGVISTKFVLEQVLERGYDPDEIEPFIKELCWRDYFQRVWQHKDINQDIRFTQSDVRMKGISQCVVDGKTGIEGIDFAIRELMNTGYMHNHARMYTAALACNHSGSHWYEPAKWMYYYLLDGDWASNACSWQWVAGANSSKKYVANQENISKYSGKKQTDTFLDVPYEKIDSVKAPDVFKQTAKFKLVTNLPETNHPEINDNLPTAVYTYYNLDPTWRREEKMNRVLLLEPSMFNEYPVSDRCLQFALDLCQNIPGIQVFVGEFSDLQLNDSICYYKEHPLSKHFVGVKDQRDWIHPERNGYYASFFAYWNTKEKIAVEY